MVGCGNSRLSEDMYEDSFTTITSIDVSRVVVDQMIARYRWGDVIDHIPQPEQLELAFLESLLCLLSADKFII